MVKQLHTIIKLTPLCVGLCGCCGGKGWYDEGFGREECSSCSGSGKDE